MRTQSQSHLSNNIKKPGFSVKDSKAFLVFREIHSFDLWGKLIIPLCKYYFKTLYIRVSLGCLIQSLHITEVNGYIFH